MAPDPQLISRRLFTRAQSRPELCNLGLGLENEDPAANCDYSKAPFFNVLAAYWIQFMTHDWFSHLSEGENGPAPSRAAGCVGAAASGCRDNDAFRPALVVDTEPSPVFEQGGSTYPSRAPRTFANTVTAWWDASQIYGYDETSRSRVKRDTADPAKLALAPLARSAKPGDEQGYLPRFAAQCSGAEGQSCDRIHPGWANQEAAAFPDNWTIGMSFYHNVFSREHNTFVDAFRVQAREQQIAACQRAFGFQRHAHVARGGHAVAVARCRQELHRQRKIDGPCEIGAEHERTLEHRDEHEILARVVARDLRAEFTNA
jgi:hypothetical protein